MMGCVSISAAVVARGSQAKVLGTAIVLLVILTLGGCGDQCETDADCNDGLWCNGEEFCRRASFFNLTAPAQCSARLSPCCSPRLVLCDVACTELAARVCVEEQETCQGGFSECEVDADCDDGVFCNGQELCESNVCVAGCSFCENSLCLEDENRCLFVVCRHEEPAIVGPGLRIRTELAECPAGSSIDSCCGSGDPSLFNPCGINPCRDGLACNGQETCTNDNGHAVCADGTPVECEAGFACNEPTGICVGPTGLQ